MQEVNRKNYKIWALGHSTLTDQKTEKEIAKGDLGVAGNIGGK